MPPRDPEVVPRASVAMDHDNGIECLTNGTNDRPEKQVPDVVPSSSDIPWRTSKRLQEATLRMLQERDAGNLNGQTVAKNADHYSSKHTAPVLANRSPKGQQGIRKGSRKKGEKIRTKDVSGVGLEVLDQEAGDSVDQKKHLEIGACQRIRKTYKRKKGIDKLSECPSLSPDSRDEGKDTKKKKGIEELSEGPSLSRDSRDEEKDTKRKKGIEELSEGSSLSRDSRHKEKDTDDKALCTSANGASPLKISKSEVDKEAAAPPSTLKAVASVIDLMKSSIVGSKGNSKQPQSCFDLLCTNIGPRGWRCYRSRVPGQIYCIYHQREMPSSSSALSK